MMNKRAPYRAWQCGSVVARGQEAILDQKKAERHMSAE